MKEELFYIVSMKKKFEIHVKVFDRVYWDIFIKKLKVFSLSLSLSWFSDVLSKKASSVMLKLTKCLFHPGKAVARGFEGKYESTTTSCKAKNLRHTGRFSDGCLAS